MIPGATTATIAPTECWVLSADSRDRALGDAVRARSAGAAATIAVTLTGYVADGDGGCRVVERLGGRVLVPDRATARAPSLPSNAIATGCADFVLPLDRLATALVALARRPRRGPIYRPLGCRPGRAWAPEARGLAVAIRENSDGHWQVR